jgi:hypothetical protein
MSSNDYNIKSLPVQIVTTYIHKNSE